MKKLSIFLFVVVSGSIIAGRVYQEPNDFLNEVFAGNVPTPQTVTLTPDKAKRVRKVLYRRLSSSELSFYQEGDRKVWILNEIGKIRPITTGFVVVGNELEQVKVLIFRESRGYEVHRERFTRQFIGAKLKKRDRLDARIDGISGATMSVNALKKMARTALILSEEEKSEDDQ